MGETGFQRPEARIDGRVEEWKIGMMALCLGYDVKRGWNPSDRLPRGPWILGEGLVSETNLPIRGTTVKEARFKTAG